MVKPSKVGGRGETHLKVDPLLQTVAARLRALRLARGLTQWAMEERGVSYKYYQRIEAGRANVTLRTLDRVARALGVSFEDLFRHPGGAGRRRLGSVQRRK
jgi:transcriptional regulator with XRE-family HTH domain